ncbi:hypothetical protein, partial [Herbaspirillum sp. VT-16-41]
FYALFVLRTSGSLSDASAAAWSMNLELKSPLSKDEFENQLYSVKKYGFDYRYSYKKQKKSRRNEKGLTTRKATKETNIQAIKTLLEQGYNLHGSNKELIVLIL